MIKRLIFSVLFYALAAAPAIAAPDRTLTLQGPASAVAVSERLEVAADPDWSRTPAEMAQAGADVFQPLGRPTIDFGYTKAVIWARVRLANNSNTNGWVIYFKENFKQIFEVFRVDSDGRIDQILKQDLDTGFDARPLDYPELAAPFRLAPGERATLLVRFWSEGSSYLPVQIETVESFATLSAKRTAKNYLYYGMMLLLIVAALVASVVFRLGVFVAYGAYASSMLLFLMHADGVTFQYLWPGWPRFNSVASIFVGSALILTAAIYTRIFLKTRALHPVLDKLLLALIVCVLAMVVASLSLDNQAIKRLLVLVALSATVLFTVSGLVAARTRFKEVRFFVFAWCGAVLSALLMTGRHWLGIEVSQDFQHDSMRIVLIFDATMMGLAIIDGFNQLRQSRLAAAEENLKLSARLQELERQVSLADEFARSQSDALQDAIHDLRQPLNALRLRIHGALADPASLAGERREINNAFAYLETLVNERLATVDAAPTAPSAAAAGAVPIAQVLESVEAMFAPDAAAQGLRFKLVPHQGETEAAALPLMRVLANLIGNAVKYTEAGGVVFGVRRLGGGVSIEVHDSGPGIDPSDFARAQGRAVRLDAGAYTEGQGLGLAIARRIADEQGWRLELDPRRRCGTGVRLIL